MTSSSSLPGRSLVPSIKFRGESQIWLTGSALVLCGLLITGLVGLILIRGSASFWPQQLVHVERTDGQKLLGPVVRQEQWVPSAATLAALPEVQSVRAAEILSTDGFIRRRLVRTANYDLGEPHFLWIGDHEISADLDPSGAVVIERETWGRFHGWIQDIHLDGQPVSSTGQEPSFEQYEASIRQRTEQIADCKIELGHLYKKQERSRKDIRQLEIDFGLPDLWFQYARTAYEAGQVGSNDEHTSAVSQLRDFEKALRPPPDASFYGQYVNAVARSESVVRVAQSETTSILADIRSLTQENDRHTLLIRSASGVDKELPMSEVVRLVRPNELGLAERFAVYFDRWLEFLFASPREANAEGGVFPAIIGTVLMTLIMTVLVVPLGVVAALYLKEYATDGVIVSTVRICVNNLAGVPSIVFGVFGLGFFCYGIGGFLDSGPSEVLPGLAWWLVLLTSAFTALVGFFIVMREVSRPPQEKNKWRSQLGFALCLASFLGLLVCLFMNPDFGGFFESSLPSPTFGKGALIWAAFTLALLTLPVVIVSTEEALSAVPNSSREGSYACGAGKWQTIRRVVLPQATGGILTGAILAMARGAGEVAPLMLVGAVKLAPELPISSDVTEFFGVNRSFMHLGFHIYDLGFQSQNSEASRPLVFTTTLLLITIIAVLNFFAISLRKRIRRKYQVHAF